MEDNRDRHRLSPRGAGIMNHLTRSGGDMGSDHRAVIAADGNGNNKRVSERRGVSSVVPPSVKLTIGRVAFIGNYLPRKCGIATFTTDLC